MRKRINKVVLMLSKIYDVTYYIAQKFYGKAKGIVEDAKIFIKLYKLSLT